MKVTDTAYLQEFNLAIGDEIENLINNFDFNNQHGDLGYQTKASAVYSSNIEGNSIDLNSFMNYEMSLEKFKPIKEIQEIENLISVYQFAQHESLNEKNLLKAHNMLAKTLVISSLQGKYRNDKVGVFGQSGLIYLAVEEQFVAKEMGALFRDIEELISLPISSKACFYFAALIHLKFAHIHPFRDGNGRAARLLEKWFITQKLGVDFWKIPSEKYYKDHQQAYYQNINLGVNFYELKYEKCLSFLKMLPNSLR